MSVSSGRSRFSSTTSVSVRPGYRRSITAPVTPQAKFDTLSQLAGPGDMLVVKGSGRLTQLGANGGFMGHVLLVTSWPRKVARESPEAVDLQAVWPAGAQCVWKVPTVESTRGRRGLHHSEMLLHVDPFTREQFLIGELIQATRELCMIENEKVEVWQSPSELRMRPRLDLMSETLGEMMAQQASWSITTAVRAAFRSSSIDTSSFDGETLMEEIRESWDVAPICTSVVIIFWQRYLEKLAQAEGQADESLVLSWMPLKADRTLPGELTQFLQISGWSCMMSV